MGGLKLRAVKRPGGKIFRLAHTDFARGVIRGLGLSPYEHRLWRSGKTLVVKTNEGAEVQRLTRGDMKELGEDAMFMAGYAEEVEAR